jgi:hypothetical protein
MKGRKPTKKIKAKGPAVHAKRVKEKIEANKSKFEENIARLKGMGNIWRLSNADSYENYNHFFGPLLGMSISEALAKIPRKKGKPLLIIEDGPLTGSFLAELKTELKKLRIPCKTIALSLKPLAELKAKKRERLIDEIIEGPAEFFVSKNLADLIISRYGSIEYTLTELKKEHLLKFAFSLKKNGIMLVGFDLSTAFSFNPKTKKPLDMFFILKKMKGIERAFEKRGFQAKFSYAVKPGLPRFVQGVLFLRRKK